MQLANCQVALGGDTGNTVPKFGVTAAEIAVLRAIHGGDAVLDVEPLEADSGRSNPEERARLVGLYGAAKDSENRSIVGSVYPNGVKVDEDFGSLGLPEQSFKPLVRATPQRRPRPLTNAEATQFANERTREGVMAGDEEPGGEVAASDIEVAEDANEASRAEAEFKNSRGAGVTEMPSYIGPEHRQDLATGSTTTAPAGPGVLG
jgi:hypothetical protein